MRSTPLSTAEFANLVEVSTATVRRWISREYFRATKHRGRWIIGPPTSRLQTQAAVVRRLVATLKKKVLRFDVDPQVRLYLVGILIDLATDMHDAHGLGTAKEALKHLAKKLTTEQQTLERYYLLSNACHGLVRIKLANDPQFAWAWDDEDIEDEILNLRLIVASPEFGSFPTLRRCQTLTNLASCLSSVGREPEAIELWNRVLELDPEFPMAVGNRGIGYYYFALANPPGYRREILKAAYLDLKDADRLRLMPEDARRFTHYAQTIEEYVCRDCLDGDEVEGGGSLGRKTAERQYRLWVLDNVLFLNPLNDIGMAADVATDEILCPDIVLPLEEYPYHQVFYQQMKQEFVSARFLCFEGLSAETTHFSDRNVLLADPLDYPAYGYAIEQVKIAFRVAYSLLDKIAGFLNTYLDLSVPPRAVSFRTIWYEDDDGDRKLRGQFDGLDNWCLRGLYWLSKDLFEQKRGFNSTLEPDAKRIWDTRNALEHQNVKVHDFPWDENWADQWAGTQPFRVDRKSFDVGRDVMAARAVRMLKLARNALLYLPMAVQCEESRRDDARADTDGVGVIEAGLIEDDWKL